MGTLVAAQCRCETPGLLRYPMLVGLISRFQDAFACGGYCPRRWAHPCAQGMCSAAAHVCFGPKADIAQSRLGGSGFFWRGPRLCLIALKRCVSSSRASIFSSSRVILDLSSSVPRNFSSALPTESLVVSAMATSHQGAVRIALARPKAKGWCHQTWLPSCPRRWRATGLIRSLTSVDGPSCLRTHRAETALVSS